MTSKSKKARRLNTSSLSQPVVEDTSSISSLSAFSPQANLFAYLSLAVDKHRLRVYDTTTGRSVAEHVLDSSRISTLVWGQIDFSERSVEETSGSAKKKGKRKRLSAGASTGNAPKSETEVIILGLSDGSLTFFSPAHGRVLRTLSDLSSTSSILSVSMTENEEGAPIILTSSADGVIRLWDPRKNSLIGSWKIDDRVPFSSMAVRPRMSSIEGGQISILVANHSIRLLSTGITDSDEFNTLKPKPIASFTGHASTIKTLHWDASREPSSRFLSMAESDRFIYLWEAPTGASEGKIVLSIPLESNVRHVSFSIPSTSTYPPSHQKQTILALASSGLISIYPVPSELSPPANSEKTKHKVPTLLSRSTVKISSKNDSVDSQIVDASFVSGEEGRIKVARIVGGVQPVFHIVQYLDDSGGFVKDINIVGDDSKTSLANQSSAAAPNKRYSESTSLAIHSGVELGQDQTMDDVALRDADGDLDVDLAEMSLGQRLTALSGGNELGGQNSTSDSEDEGVDVSGRRSSKQKMRQDVGLSVVPANSLTRTLIQALHSSDSRLLETCLAHSDQTLIRNTVRRLPPQLAVPLLTACVERLSRGSRAANMKGSGGGASSQRGTGLIGWVKAVLAVHSGHLMTMPDLVARLSGLHATLTTRLTLQDSLLSLSGRLDMVLSQIEMRSSVAPAALAPQKDNKGRSTKTKRETRKYVEGESEDEENQMDVEVEMDSDEDGGSVEDVELGADSQDDSEEDDDDEDDYDDDEGPTLNGFIDDEADEFSEDEDDEESD